MQMLGGRQGGGAPAGGQQQGGWGQPQQPQQPQGGNQFSGGAQSRPQQSTPLRLTNRQWILTTISRSDLLTKNQCVIRDFRRNSCLPKCLV